MTARIEALTDLSAADVARLVTGYVSSQRYDVRKTEDAGRTEFVLELIDLDAPFVKETTVEDVNVEEYRRFLGEGLSFGAWIEGRLVGLAVTEGREWNKTAFVWQMRVEQAVRGQGIGKRLLAAVEDAACRAGFRVVECETQTPNVAAIAFYRSCGYTMSGIDVTFYSNEDVARGEVAVFMKKPVR